MSNEDKMTTDERLEYLRRMKKRYLRASGKERGQLLDEMEMVTELHRKSLVPLMNSTLERAPGRLASWLVSWLLSDDSAPPGEDATAAGAHSAEESKKRSFWAAGWNEGLGRTACLGRPWAAIGPAGTSLNHAARPLQAVWYLDKNLSTSSMNAAVAVSMPEVKPSGSLKSKSLTRSHSTMESTPLAGVITRYALH